LHPIIDAWGDGGVGRLAVRLMLTIMEYAMTLYEEHQAALAELEKSEAEKFFTERGPNIRPCQHRRNSEKAK